MTPFELIVITLIYLFCYGYTIAIFIKEENTWLRIVLCLFSLVFAFYAPLYIGGAVFEKLNNKKS